MAPINPERRALTPLDISVQSKVDSLKVGLSASGNPVANLGLAVTAMIIPKRSQKLYGVLPGADSDSKDSDNTAGEGRAAVTLSDSKSRSRRRRFTAQTERLQRCKFTLAGFASEDLVCKMTGRMITELKNHLSVRLPASRFESLFAGQSYPIDTTYMSQPLHVCSEAYEMYRCEAQLKVVETGFAKAIGIPTIQEVAAEGKLFDFLRLCCI